jgi:UDP-N-acetylmuramyl tripeptide synthase
VSATNGKTTTTAMLAEILGAKHELAWNRAGANLLSGITSALVAGRRADFGLFEVDEGALPEALERTRPTAVVLGNLFRDQLDRYGELEIVAERWRTAVARLPEATTLVVNADDSIVADLASGRTEVLRFGLDDPRHSHAGLQHAADSKYCVRCGAPYAFDAAYVGHLGDYHCPSCGHRRPPLDVAAREIELGKQLNLTVRGQGGNGKTIGECGDNIKGLTSDGSGRPQHAYGFHGSSIERQRPAVKATTG